MTNSRTIPNFPNYSVNRNGEVFSNYTKKILSERKCSGGYPRVCLYSKFAKRKDIRVHRIVAELFLPNPDNLPVVNHINGDKTDNRVDNLEWCTHVHNSNHAFETGLTPKKQKKLSNTQLNECARAYLNGEGIRSISARYGVSRKAVEEHILRDSAVACAGKNLHKKLGAAKTGKALSIKVCQLSLDGVLLKEWDSMIQAAKALGLNAGNISNVISGRSKTSGGFKWERK